MDPLDSDAVLQLTGPIAIPVDTRAIAFCVHHSGRCFRTSFDLAGAFVRQAHQIVDEGQAELVPLLHEHGVELLLVSATSPLQIHDVRDHSFDRMHPATN